MDPTGFHWMSWVLLLGEKKCEKEISVEMNYFLIYNNL